MLLCLGQEIPINIIVDNIVIIIIITVIIIIIVMLPWLLCSFAAQRAANIQR